MDKRLEVQIEERPTKRDRNDDRIDQLALEIARLRRIQRILNDDEPTKSMDYARTMRTYSAAPPARERKPFYEREVPLQRNQTDPPKPTDFNVERYHNRGKIPRYQRRSD